MNASASPTAPFSFHPHVILLAVLLCLPCGNMLAQADNPNYTSDMPSVERVKAEIKGSDPTDTLARQVAVFAYLSTQIQRIKYNRTIDGPYTPDELRVMGAYDLASYQITQDYVKSHSPREAEAFDRLSFQYQMNSDFYKDWSSRLVGKQATAAYHGMESEMGARQKAHVDSIHRANEEALRASGDRTKDPTAVATRRCLELGGTTGECLGKGFSSGVMGLMGLVGFHAEDFTGPSRVGVILSGPYHSRSTLASLGFAADSVAIQDCGKLVADGHGYTITKRPGSLQVIVANEPDPIILSMRPDGGLTGPGPVDVKGRIIIGYHTVTSTLYRDGVPAAAGTCNGPCTTSTQVPDYAPKIERCTIGSLSTPPPAKPDAKLSGVSGAMLGLVAGVSSTTLNPEPGIRMTGQYASGHLLLDFNENSVILDCGEAHVKQPYTVENAPEQLLVHVENNGGSFTLTLMPDNSLRGSGNTTVNGRLVTGMNGENVTFAPHSESCEVASFSPKSGSAPTTSVASATHAPTPDASASVTPVSAAPPATPAGMMLAITTSFPGGPNPLAGRVVQLMSERYDIALRKVGAPIAADVTPGRALMAYMANCGPPKSCPAYATAMHPYFVGKATFDSNGTATVTADVPPGSYYVFSAASGTSGALVWDLPITLKVADNTITLTATNAELVH